MFPPCKQQHHQFSSLDNFGEKLYNFEVMKDPLYRKRLLLEYVTVAYNIVEACALQSFALLVGLGFNYVFGFWLADSVKGIIISAFLLRVGILGWQESSE